MLNSEFMKNLCRIFFFFFFFISPLICSDEKNSMPPPVLGADAFFQYHKPIYAVIGKADAKIQISFKYRLLNAHNFFLGFTQHMFWDVFDDSLPVKRLDYNPELFWRFYPVKKFIEHVDVGIYEHISNGQAGIYSRSLDGGYLRVNAERKIKGLNVAMNIKLFKYYATGGHTEEIKNYIGYSEIGFSAEQFCAPLLKHIRIYGNLISPGKFSHDRWRRGAKEFGVLFNRAKTPFSPDIYFQVYSGYAESLLEFPEKNTVYRVGLLFE